MLRHDGGPAEGVDQSGRIEGFARIIGHSPELRFMRSEVNAHCVTQPAKLWTMDTIAKRLRWARERKFGKDSKATEVARDRGWTVSTYLGHENGDRNPSRTTAKKYASAYGIRWEWLLENEGSPASNRIDIPQEISVSEDGAPDQVRFIVRMPGGLARYITKEHVFDAEKPDAPRRLIGRECVVKLPDGQTLVRFLRAGSKDNRFKLEAHGAPPLEDQKIEWAAPVKWRG